MTWEWEHGRQGGQWVMTVGGWHAVVQRVGSGRILWQATLTRTTTPQDQYMSPTYPDAAVGRTILQIAYHQFAYSLQLHEWLAHQIADEIE